MAIVTLLGLFAGTASTAACTEVNEPVPSLATTRLPAGRLPVGAATGLNAHCLLLFAVQVSWMMAAPELVEAPWSEMHRPLLTLTIWWVPEPEATNRHCWFVPDPQDHCCNR